MGHANIVHSLYTRSGRISPLEVKVKAKISTVGGDIAAYNLWALYSSQQRSINQYSKGFTLLELLVVMAIVALVITAIPPLFTAATGTAELKGATHQLAVGLRFVRSQAIARNQSAVMLLDVEKRRYRLSGVPREYRLPAQLDLKLFAAKSEFLNPTSGAIRFFPDGSSTGGKITVTRGDRAYEIEVNWLTGQVSIHG